jgi:hypothetical protein
MNIIFPKDPCDGDVFEYSYGIYFQYSEVTKTWKKIVGLSNVPMASVDNDGLMSKDDFNKLQSLIIPPPQTTLTADECNTTFREGIVRIESSKNDLNIVHDLSVFNKTEKEKIDFIIHENTFGIDFSINLNRLIEELESRNKIKYRSTQGDDGDQGERGKPGRDRIETGPRGLKGDNGKNAPFPGTLVQDFTTIDQTKIKKVVVDIKNDIDDPKKLIVVFGNVGNLLACPSKVNWKNKNTPWLVALKDKIGACFLPNNCRGVCSTELYYVDTTTIQDQIKERFIELLLAAKTERENLAKSWLNSMIEMFNSQKQAVCCAIEAIDSKEKNQDIRNIWSTGRYAAAQAMYAFTVSSGGSTQYPRADPQQHPQDFIPTGQGTSQGGAVFNGDDPATFKCKECFLIVDLLSYNVGQSRPINVELPKGDYTSTIISCCPEFDRSGYSGKYSIKFNNNNTYTTYTSSDYGYLGPHEANAAYVGDSLSFKHNGGVASFYLDPPPSSSGGVVSLNGNVRLCVQLDKCFENPTAGTGTDLTISDMPHSFIRASHAEFYERGWRIGKSCAAHTSVYGTQFIVVFRSLGTDVSCGGGEYAHTAFIKYFQDVLDEHVAIAWPTIDGDGFFGLPRDDGRLKIKLVYDKDLSDIIINNINNDIIFKKIGDPKSVIKRVVVPILNQAIVTGTDGSWTSDYELVKTLGIMWSFDSSINAKMIDTNKMLSQDEYPVTSLCDDTIEVIDNALSSCGINIKAISGNIPTKVKAVSFWFKPATAQSNFAITINPAPGSEIPRYILLVRVNDVDVNNNDLRQTDVISYVNQDNLVVNGLTGISILIPNNEWINIVVSRVSEQYADIYINGFKNGIIGPIDDIDSWNNQPTLVNLVNSTSGGLIDQVRLYDNTITLEMVMALYRIGRNV